MTVDRPTNEQIRKWARLQWGEPNIVATILAELEQAERERDEARGERAALILQLEGQKYDKREARLAKVPALVDDAIQLCDQHISDEQRKETQRRVMEWAKAWPTE